MPACVNASGEIIVLFILYLLAHSAYRAYKGPSAANTRVLSEAEGLEALESEDPNVGPAPDPAPPPSLALILPARMPLGRRLRSWWQRFFRSRDAMEGEWLLDLDEPGLYRLTLPMPRRVVRLDLLFHAPGVIPLARIEFTPAVAGPEPVWSGRWKREDGRMRLRLELDGAVRLTRISVATLEKGVWHCRSELRVLAWGEPDAPALRAAETARQQNLLGEFRRRLVDYERHCTTNPIVALYLAQLHALAGEDALAEIDALRCIGLGRIQPGLELLRLLFGRRPWQMGPARLQELLVEAAHWDLPSHPGLVALVLDRSFLTGPGGYQRERLHAAYLVRRRAAARTYRQVSVPVSSESGALIATAARVCRADGRVERLDDERFTVGRAEDDNPFVAVARRQTGIWILPDLSPGDVVEFTWDSVLLVKDEKARHGHFMLANLADPDTPALHGRVIFTAPPDWELSFATRNMDPQRQTFVDKATGWNSTVFAGDRVMPRQSHSMPFQSTALNPVVGCARSGGDWAEVGRDLLLAAGLAAATAAPEVPAPLAAACAGGGSPREILARAFYWVRDHIKYASVVSGNRDLDSPDRAARVVAAGVGDCKDSSLLLAVVCQHHGIPWELVLVSTAHGLVLEELPADQFDHLLVRAQVDGAWTYLDAAGSLGIFSAPSPALQGLTALAGRDRGALVRIPDSPPECTRAVVREIIDRIEDGWLAGTVELILEGYLARALNEAWKQRSLSSLDPERAGDAVLHGMLPGFQFESVDWLQDTASSDVLHVALRGRRAPLIAMDHQRIATLAFEPPGLPALGGRPRIRERFLFALCMDVEHRLEIAGEALRALRAVSSVDGLATGFCRLTEERGADGACVVRRILVSRRDVEGAELDELPRVLQHIGEAGRLVVSLDG